MKIKSDTISSGDLTDAARAAGVSLAVCDRIATRRPGWSVSLSGSSPYHSQMSGAKAATWDEWGIFIAALFDRDPSATIGIYKTPEQFVSLTTAARDHNARYAKRSDRTAPWLTA